MRVITNTNVSSKLIFEGNDPSGRSRWASALRAAHANPFGCLLLRFGPAGTFTRLRLRSSGSSPLEAASSKIRKDVGIRFLSFLTASALMLGAGKALAQGPIKIGFISPISGAIAQAGKDMYNGCVIAWGSQKTFDRNHGQMIEHECVPLYVQDYTPYLGQVKKEDDGLCVLALLRWSLLVANACGASSLKGRLRVIAGGTHTDEHILP